MQHTPNLVVGDDDPLLAVERNLRVAGPRRLLLLFKFLRRLRRSRRFILTSSCAGQAEHLVRGTSHAG
ncbi:MAG: hypothetical protein WAS21_02260 [Geminicoccaceae bacterium]